MNASVAADLFVYAMLIGPTMFPWGTPYAFVNQTEFLQRFPVPSTSNDSRSVSGSAPRLFGLLPPNATDEKTQTNWFMRESVASIVRQFANASRTRRSNLALEFSHTQLTPNISFDALTMDIQLDPNLLATITSPDNKTHYTILDQIDNCTWPEHCMIRKVDYKVVEPMYDPPAQVFAYRLCSDANGTEVIPGNVSITSNNSITFLDPDCSLSDLNAVLVVSVGKRLEADALEQNLSRTADGKTTINTTLATVTNLRKIYSFTVGRLSWEFTDLATTFNAECTPNIDCRGLELELGDHVSASTPSSTNHTTQRLLVGRDHLPLYTLDTLSEELSFGKTDLLVLNEPPDIPKPSSLYRIIAGDILLPHNIQNLSWDARLARNQDCSVRVADRVVQTLDNHYYMEHTLQTTYTTALFFLFQNAVVRDELRLDTSHASLVFSANSQQIAVWASTPQQNMWLTLRGCAILTMGLVVVLIKAMWYGRSEQGAFANISDPQAIARVLLDERQYPPLFLHRRVVERHGVDSVDNFAIAALSLQQQPSVEATGPQRSGTKQPADMA